jgi:hypothetical protein
MKEGKAMELPEKNEKEIRGLDRYLIFSFGMIIIFTIAQSIITAITGVEQSTLITCFFGIFGGETLLCAVIKRLKIKYENDETEEKKDE